MKNKQYLLIAIIIISNITIGCNNTATPKNIADNISANNIILKINNEENIEFVDKTINGNLDFSTISDTYTRNPTIAVAEINSSITFINCHFTDSIIGFKVANDYAYITNFKKNMTFIDCTFDKNINFRQAVFNDIVEFSRCIFKDEVRFEGAVFYANNTYFHESTFEKLAKFTNASFYGDVTFMNAIFESDASFNNSFFNKNGNFAGCNYSEMANFGNIEVRGFFRINYSIYEQKVYFENCTFFGKIEAVKINSKSNFYFCKNDCRSFADFNTSIFDGKINISENFFITETTNFQDITISENCEVENQNNKSLNTNEFKIN